MDIFRRNLDLLSRLNPAVAAWVENGTARLELREVPDPSGRARILVDRSLEILPAAGGEASAGAPERDLLPPAWRTCVLFGFGLGRFWENLNWNSPPDRRFLVVEEDPGLLRLALSRLDLTGPLIEGRLLFGLPDEDGLMRLAQGLGRQLRLGEAGFVVDENCRRYFSRQFRDRIDRFARIAGNEAIREKALIRDSALMVENELRNLPLTLLSPGISDLKDAFKGRPALVVSAGPSLGLQAHLLSRAAGRAVIIAAAPVLRLLLAHDLVPDLTATLDYTAGNSGVGDVGAVEEAPLVFMEGARPEAVFGRQGPLFSVLHQDGPLRKWLGPLMPDREYWPVGGNVGSFCLDLALHFGADPVILVGQDLAFPDQKLHCEGCLDSERPERMPNPVHLEAVGGGRVLSNLTFAGYLREFNETIAAGQAVFVNTSPNGARIEGTLEMPLEQALDQYCREEVNPGPIIRGALDKPRPDLRAVREELTGLKEELDALEVVAAKALEFNGDILEMAANAAGPEDQALRERIRVHAQYTQGAQKYWSVFAPLQKYLTRPIALLSEDGRLKNRGRNWRETIDEVMDRNRVMMEAALEGVRGLRDIFLDAESRLAAVLEAELGLAQEPGSAENHLAAGRAWSALGRSLKAWPHFRTALTLKPQDEALTIEAARSCLNRERLAPAREILAGLLARRPDHREAAELDDEIQTRVQGWLLDSSRLLAQGDWVGALTLIRKFRAYDPDDQAGRNIEAECLQKRSESNREADRKRSRLWSEATLRGLMDEAVVEFEAGRHREVVDLLSGRLDPDEAEHHEALVHLGVSLAALGRGPEGLALLREIRKRRPNWAYAHAKLGPLLLENGFTAPALEMMEQAGRMEAEYQDYLFQAGCVRLQSGQPDRALDDFRLFLNRNPGCAETLSKIGICHLALGRRESARRSFEEALVCNPGLESAQVGLAQISDCGQLRS